jgi:hypothetical protein
MYHAMYPEFAEYFRYSFHPFLTDGGRKPKFEFSPLFNYPGFKGEAQKVKLLVFHFERWLSFLIPPAIHDFTFLLV